MFYQGSVTTPLLTPGQPHHMPPPRGPMVMHTPHYPVTPNAAGPGWPPSNYPVTPQHVRSPRPQWAGTPLINQTPRPGPAIITTPKPSGSGATTHQDWGKMAQLWARNKTMQSEQISSSNRMTPRPRAASSRQSPYVTMLGDSTPLIDEH